MRILGETVEQLAGRPTFQRRCSTAGLVSGSVGVVDGVMCSFKGAAGGE